MLDVYYNDCVLPGNAGGMADGKPAAPGMLGVAMETTGVTSVVLEVRL